MITTIDDLVKLTEELADLGVVSFKVGDVEVNLNPFKGAVNLKDLMETEVVDEKRRKALGYSEEELYGVEAD